MTRLVLPFSLSFTLLLLAPGLSGAAAPAPPSKSGADDPARRFTVTPLADGVYAVIRDDRPGFMVDANNLFIVNERDVVVVDSNGAPAITRQVVAALKRLTDKPVRYVVNTHYHDDHIRGNQVWREAYPGVEFIAHAFAREYLPGQGAVNRKNFLTGAPAFLEDLRGALKSGRGLTGAPLTAEERDSLESDVSLAGLVLSEGEKAETVLPTITVRDRLTLERGARVIDILHLGSGHTAADLVVHLPREGIVATGDLVVWPVPLVGDPQSHIAAWGKTLQRLRDLHASILVPGHGPILRDDAYVRTLQEMFTSIAAQAQEAVRGGAVGDAARRKIDLQPYRQGLAGDSPVRRGLFQMYVAQPAVAAALREAAEGAAGGAPDPAASSGGADEVRATETAFARTLAARDHAAFTALLADEAIFFGSTRVLRGRAAVSEGWARFFEGPDAPFSWAPERVEVLDSGRLALSTGPVFDPAGRRTGTFNSIWRREDDGRWRIVFDNGCPPCAAAGTH
ncbi:MAG TPA: MBL fold metallo-hydrolase [Candidatus Polarisedimenticolia bacterium]|nr:MBL fold metallo-hydrolase [Candidatus Polarisedimenticolia bacterium]